MPVSGAWKNPSQRATNQSFGRAGSNGEVSPQSTLTCGSVRTSTGCCCALISPLCDRSGKYDARRPFCCSCCELYVIDNPAVPPTVVNVGEEIDVVTLPLARFTLIGPTVSPGAGPRSPMRWSTLRWNTPVGTVVMPL